MLSKFRPSLKVKLMLLLSITASAVLSVFAYFALTDFEQDKIAYVFDVTRAHVRTVAGQIRTELKFHANTIMQVIVQSDNGSAVQLPESYSFLRVYTYNNVESKYDLQQFNSAEEAKNSKKKLAVTGEMFKEAMESDVSLRLVSNGQWLLALKLDIRGQQKLALALINEGAFVDSLYGVQAQNTYLVNFLGKVIVQPKFPTFEIADENLRATIQEVVAQLDTPEKVMELEVGQSPWLAAVADSGTGELKVVSLLPKRAALEAVYGLALKSLIVMGFLLFATILISVVGANGLTSTLQRLSLATEKVSDGDFDVEVEVRSHDEVGILAKGFNKMTGEIRRLISETAQKARMEEELKTAQLVQATLFPEWEYSDEEVEVRGFYEPASECSGDWWHYKKSGDLLLMFIGDATGHGMPAALVTSAAKSASTILEKDPNIDVSFVLEALNSAVYQTTKGQVNMTFFVGCLNTKTGEFTYSNASHDPPFLVRGGPEKVKKRDFEPLLESLGHRLGEGPDAKYTKTTLQLKADDRIVFYTDGVTELAGPEGKLWGERKFITTLITGFNGDNSIELAMSNLQTDIEGFRGGEKLLDDVTYFMMRYKKAS